MKPNAQEITQVSVSLAARGRIPLNDSIQVNCMKT